MFERIVAAIDSDPQRGAKVVAAAQELAQTFGSTPCSSALHPILPDTVQAGNGLSQVMYFYGQEQDGSYFNAHFFLAGGRGASRGRDVPAEAPGKPITEVSLSAVLATGIIRLILACDARLVDACPFRSATTEAQR
jgi:hypothetical protein